MAEYSLETTQNVVAHKLLGLVTTAFDVEAGKTLKVETSPQGTELLEETVPEGKVWKVTLQINVTEVNVEDA